MVSKEIVSLALRMDRGLLHFCSPLSRFFFGIRRDPASFLSSTLPLKSSHLLRLNVRNLNKQSKLFSQGMSPIFMTVPLTAHGSQLQPPLSCTQRWERLRERPAYGPLESSSSSSSGGGGSFDISFRVRVEARSVTYVAFSYPYTYRELQTNLARLERKHAGPKSASASPGFEALSEKSPDR